MDSNHVECTIQRPVLRATITRLLPNHTAIAAELQRQMGFGPLPKPVRHTGGVESDRFAIQLQAELIDEIVSALGDLEAALVVANAPPLQVSATADLLDYWNQLLQGDA